MKRKRSSGQLQATTAQLKGGPLRAAGVACPRIPDHELLRCIGRGSYGEVWLARNVLGSYRAVKVVQRNSFLDPQPFEREFRGICKFEPISRTHSSLVNILHVGRNEAAGHFYYIMELADDVFCGQAIQPETYAPRTLRAELVRRGPFPLVECLQIGLVLTTALEYLHKQGLVHRDLKPSNIIFVDGAPKLADIGLVTDISEATTSVGTPGYLAPEGPGTPLADIYSLGKVLYEISTGKDRQQFPDWPSKRDKSRGGDQFLRFNEAVLQACENNPRNRFRSAQEFGAALLQCQPGAAQRPCHEQTVMLPALAAPERSERKLLTILCVKITLTRKLDPEEEQNFLQGCFRAINPLIESYGGRNAQVVGDGLMALFGAPVAYEDHAVRAVHAALAAASALQTVLEGRMPGTDFEVRFGLSTGLALIGEGKDRAPCSALGDAVNLAWRILSVTRHSEIVVAAQTYKVVKDFFFAHPRGARRLQGMASPVKLYTISRARELRTRIEARARSGLTPFVGRARELALLRERLADAGEGRGQIVMLGGEAGVGKSRLLLEFRNSLNGIEGTWLAGRSLSFGKQIAYLPIIDLLKRMFQIEETDEGASITRKIKTKLAELGGEVPFAEALVKYLLTVGSGDSAVLEMDAQQRRIRTFEAVRQLLLQQAQHSPLILALEDLHWTDKTSEDFLVSLADSVATARVLLLLSCRPEYRNPFPERSYVTRLTLRELNFEESGELARNALAGAELPPALQRLIMAKAEGNPFFVEEIIHSLIETGALRHRAGRCSLAKSLAAIHLPDTIQDVIMGRIDRLDESPRRALQLASVIGREFAIGLLATIADLHEPLAESLHKLKSLELIYERSRFPDHTCIFKHALTQEVAYNSLLIQRRKELHCLVAAAIEELYARRLPEFYGLLAYHYERGEEWERALEYLIRAAEHSHHAAAYREEAPLLSHAMEIAERLGRPAVAADLRGRRGTAWARVGMWAQARPDLERALAELPTERVEQRAELLFDLAGVCFWAMDIRGVCRYAREGHTASEAADRDDLAGAIMGWLAAAENSAGNLAAAADLYERALARSRGFRGPSLALYPLTLYLRGRIAEAVERGRESAQMCRNLSDTLATTFGHPHLGLALAAAGRYREAMLVFEEARQLALKHEVWPFHARAIAMSAGFHLDVFDFAGHEELAEEARERASSAGFQPSVISASLDLVFNFTRRHEIARAQRLTEQTAAAALKTGDWHRWLWELRLMQARSELALATENWDTARRWAAKSIAESHRRGRPKYEVAGLEVRAKSSAALGRKKEAISDLRQAIQLSREVGDPAMLLHASVALLAIEGDEVLLADARAAARHILAELPSREMRQRFESAEPVRQLGSWK